MSANMARAYFLLAMVNVGVLLGLALVGYPAFVLYAVLAAAFAAGFLRMAEEAS